MTKVYEAVLQHAINNTLKETNKIELTNFLNQNTDMNITVGGLAINTMIRQAYNYYMKKKEYTNAYLILDTYRPEMYVWKVLNNYNLK
ncbi:hypothetical protein [Formosa algae]|uniref:hypothetical protein n=1 Tax=Formosa algae TaxID=225843 RepID=UPI000CCF07E5|nr:hypothetical protein [Formosa algae]PNW26940.1 hypothetical protein BKP44_15180 [Formosa algae]